MIKIAKYPRIVFLALFLIIYFATYFCGLENAVIRAASSATLAFILASKRKEFKTQTGTKTQVTWFLLKEPIILE
ncbi:MAG: hypothetical protein HWD82_03770 [Flavobacteriaceae bacterium]|nr:hypothetical protein [Flavobacteriaceae bacterium]